MSDKPSLLKVTEATKLIVFVFALGVAFQLGVGLTSLATPSVRKIEIHRIAQAEQVESEQHRRHRGSHTAIAGDQKVLGEE